MSSTLHELAAERRAVSRAVSALRLTAVMFEAGARPHLPGELYRAYLAQSDVFVGVYWQRYGELVPGLDVSGLEEEFELSQGMPRLLYLKTPAPDRDPRLTQLIRRIGREAAYRPFRTPAELGRLVRDDLAQLLSERFTAAPTAPAAPAAAGATAARPVTRSVLTLAPLPVSTTSLVGRQQAVADVADLLSRSGRRWVTLTGPGGIGKTRLALAAAEQLRPQFDAGTVFVPLAELTDPAAVVPRIGWALGADLAGATTPVPALADLLGRDRWLLVLDNLEHLVAAGPELAELLTRCPGLAVLATSRTVMGVQAEQAYPVPPLPVPETSDLPDVAENPAVRLFLERARAVRPDFALTADGAQAVVEICRRLEGVPLAIELAAARVQLLGPGTVLSRLSRSLDTLGTGATDLPERQRTLRAAVDWSIGMLDDAERSLLEVLAVFADGWSLAAAAHVAGLDEDRVLDLTESLARHSLIHVAVRPTGPRPRKLHPVRAFVAERLAARPDVDEVRRRHAEHYRALAESADRPLRGFRQRACAEVLVRESDNIVTAVRWHLAHDPAPLPHLFRVLSPFRVLWPFLGLGDVIIGEARSWVAELLPTEDGLPAASRAELLSTALVSALEVGDATAVRATSERLAALIGEVEDPYLDAVSRLLLAWAAALVRDLDGARRGLRTALDRLRGLDEPMWTGFALVTAGSVEAALGDPADALRHATGAHHLAGRFDTPWLAAVSRVVLAGLAVGRGDLDEARALLGEALDLSESGHSTHCLCLALAGVSAMSLAEGDAERAGLLAGATEGLRRRAGLRVYASMRGDGDLADAVRAAAGSARFDELFTAGSRLALAEVLDLAHDHLRRGR
ncbi:ATP-binding protein [Modestobacter sp. SYSU DS0511]